MKVVLINGSPHKDGNTHDMLNDIIEELHRQNIETETFWIGTKPIHGCIACGRCDKTHRCIFDDDITNRVIEAMYEADGFIVGSPVYYAGPNGALMAILDRAFYAADKECFHHKPAAACVVARRAGTTAALDDLLKYFTITEMPVVSSTYWNMEHGRRPGETREDKEGIYTMQRLAKNMAWLLRAIKLAKEHDDFPPEIDTDRPWTHFVR